ncbi:hypothetical protein BGZ98_004076, partial [Dissophora globulifera]
TYLAAQSLPNLTVWNRSPEKSQTLQSKLPSIQAAVSIDELITLHKANIIFTSLQNDDAVQQVYSILTSLAASASYPIIFVETGTLYPDLSVRLQTDITNLSIKTPGTPKHVFLQCPVFGRPEAARAAQMVWVTSGDPAAIQQVLPYINAMSRQVLDLKTTDVAAGATMKLLGNFMLGSMIEVIAESTNLARKSNLDPQQLIAFVDTFLPAPAIKDYSRQLTGGEEAPGAVGMTVNVMSKDMGLLKKWGDEKKSPLPTAGLLLKNLDAAREKGFTQNWNFMVDALNNSEHD